MQPEVQNAIAQEVGRLRLAEIEAQVMVGLLQQENERLRARVAELEGAAKDDAP